jgi:transcriptional regulator with XRE-family HTH domain
MEKKLDLTQVRDLRQRHKLSQSDFWPRFGVTQSGGSRFERGRSLARPVALLIQLWRSGDISDAQLDKAAKTLGWPKPKAPAK